MIMTFQSPSLTVRLYHRDDTDCPEGAKQMLGPVHRVGCAKGTSCQSAVRAPLTARATHYARVEEPTADLRQLVRAMYLCDDCAHAFAREHGIALEAPRP
jgi:hypothetical protein